MTDERIEELFRETWNQMKALSSTLNARIDGVANELAGVKSELVEVKSDIRTIRSDLDELRTVTKDVVFELAGMKVELRGTRLAYSALSAELVALRARPPRE